MTWVIRFHKEHTLVSADVAKATSTNTTSVRTNSMLNNLTETNDNIKKKLYLGTAFLYIFFYTFIRVCNVCLIL